MKLRLFSVDFEEGVIAFRVPQDVMASHRWGFGVAEIDLSSIMHPMNSPQLAESPANGEQQANHNKCPWFIDGWKCANQNTLLNSYGQPCTFDRGKRS